MPVLSLLLPLAGCTSYLGTARDFHPDELGRPGWHTVPGVPIIRQQKEADCGAAALAMVLAYWRAGSADVPCDAVRGTRAGDLRDAARKRGLKAYLFRGEFEDLVRELSRGRPVIVGLVKPDLRGMRTHFEVVAAIHPGRQIVVTLDPSHGWRRNDYCNFLNEWAPSERLTLVMFRAEESAIQPKR